MARFKRRMCPKCKQDYKKVLEQCPFCGEPNPKVRIIKGNYKKPRPTP